MTVGFNYYKNSVNICLNCKHHKLSVNPELSEIKEWCEIHQKLKGTCNDYEEEV